MAGIYCRMHGSEGADAGCFGYEFWRLYDPKYSSRFDNHVRKRLPGSEAGYDCQNFIWRCYLIHFMMRASITGRYDMEKF